MAAALTGSVTFTHGVTIIASAKLAPDGTAAMSSTLAPGAHALEATYGGDANDMPSASSALPLAVNRASTAVSLTSSASPALALSSISFTAIVCGNGGTPAGSITFIVDGGSAASATLDAMGTATYSNSGLRVGTPLVTAGYSGDGNDDMNTSAPLAQIAQAIPTTTNLRGTSNDEFERAMIRERQLEGIAKAKQAGKYRGRPSTMTAAHVQAIRDRARVGERKAAIAREFGVTRQTIYNFLAA